MWANEQLLRNKGLIQRIQKVSSVGCNWFISLRGTELWVTINFLGMYCYFPVIQLVNFVFNHFISDLIPSSSPVFIVKYILFFSFLFINRPRRSEVDSRHSYHTNDHRIPWLTLRNKSFSRSATSDTKSYASKDQIKPWAPTNRIWLQKYKRHKMSVATYRNWKFSTFETNLSS